MIEGDLLLLRQVVARAIQASGLLRREVERALRLRSGSLTRLLDGSLDLKVEHLTALARLLRVPPGDFLRIGCPQTRAAATYRLADWLGPAAAPEAPAAAAPPSPEELAAMIRSALQQELAARKGT
ncbi:MAG: hypothetical protein JF614_05870 [Acidobacteria bacterium]|nr:hypothetical protein [Acidobacteriota bacterium]